MLLGIIEGLRPRTTRNVSFCPPLAIPLMHLSSRGESCRVRRGYYVRSCLDRVFILELYSLIVRPGIIDMYGLFDLEY